MNKTNKYEHLEKINIITPSLMPKIYEFLAHIDVSEDIPILITGPTGVGKSLFINIFRKKRKNIKIINCAHIEPTLAESELFGHLRGSFTGAIQDKKGLLGDANGKTIVLDEIGELPKNVQAKLLTFIEDGSYYKIGSAKQETSNVRIMGVTSRKKKLRKDFINRFFQFSIPPLYERRMDVLYYIAALAPDVIKTLTPSDVFMLVTNNWPGNIREINNAILSLKRRERMDELMNYPPGMVVPSIDFDNYGSENSPLKKLGFLLTKLRMSKINLTELDNFLGSYGLGFDIDNQRKVFEKFDKEEFKNKCFGGVGKKGWGAEFEENYGIRPMRLYGPFNKVGEGLELFSSVFFQDRFLDKNLLDLREGGRILSFATEKKGSQMFNSIFEFLVGIKLPPHMDFSHSWVDERLNNISELLMLYPQNRFLKSIAKNNVLPKRHLEKQTDIWSMNLKELEVHYFKGLINLSDGNKRKASEKAGLIYNTFISRLNKLKKEGYI